MTTNSTLRFAEVGNVLVVVHGTGSPSAEDWQRYCAALQPNDPRPKLIYSPGGAPTALQREQLRTIYAGGEPPAMAFLTSAPAVVAAMRSLNWFLEDRLRAFHPADLDGALAHLEQAGALFDPDELLLKLNELAFALKSPLPLSRASWVSLQGGY